LKILLYHIYAKKSIDKFKICVENLSVMAAPCHLHLKGEALAVILLTLTVAYKQGSPFKESCRTEGATERSGSLRQPTQKDCEHTPTVFSIETKFTLWIIL
jgi:hypothetical protein